MRIAQVCPRFLPYVGGVEIHVNEISRRLTEEFNIEILTTDPSGKLPEVEKLNGVTVRRFKSFAPSESYYYSPSLRKFLEKNSNNYDIIHAHSYHAFPAYYASLSLKKSKGQKFVFTPHYHGKGHSLVRNLLHKPYRLFGSQIFKKSDAVICVSKFEKDLILRNFRISRDKVHLIPNGINVGDFTNISVKKDKKRNRRLIIYVGRIEKYKGIDYLIKALTKLDNNYFLEIIGKGPYKPKITKLARKLGVLDRIRFYHDLQRDKLIQKYAEADVLVLLSKMEAYGIVVAEALASKTPCIVAREAALEEWVDNRNVFGISYPINLDELVNLIEKVSEMSIGENIRLRSWDDVAREIGRLYGSLLQSNE